MADEVYFLTNEDLERLLALLGGKANKSDIITQFPASAIISGCLPIKHGGTEANNAEQARKNLGIDDFVMNVFNGCPKMVAGTYTGAVPYQSRSDGSATVYAEQKIPLNGRIKLMIITTESDSGSLNNCFAVISSTGAVTEFQFSESHLMFETMDFAGEREYIYPEMPIYFAQRYGSATISDDGVTLSVATKGCNTHNQSYMAREGKLYSYVAFF